MQQVYEELMLHSPQIKSQFSLLKFPTSKHSTPNVNKQHAHISLASVQSSLHIFWGIFNIFPISFCAGKTPFQLPNNMPRYFDMNLHAEQI